MNVKMVAVDLDGTLLRTDETISGYTIDVFERLRDLGIKVVFATARTVAGSQSFRAALNPDGDVVTGGCLVFAGSQLLRSYYFDSQWDGLLAELAENPLVTRVSGYALNATYSSILIEGRICADFKSPLPEKLLHCSFRTNDSELARAIAARYPELSFLHTSGGDMYDIYPKDVTKLSGIKIIAEHFNICLSEVVAFGNDYNDIEMLKGCGVGVAVGNAIDECKAVADWVCDTNDNDGVAKWLERHIFQVCT